jgi:beta-lactamase class A
MEAVPGDWLVTSYTELSPTEGVGIIAAGDERAQVSLSVDPELDNRISGLLIQPAGLASTPDSFENAISRLEQQGTLRMVAAEVVDGECQPIEAVSADDPMPIGSSFKLFVLGTLVDAVAAGDVAWDDETTIRNELKSIPTGILQDEADGTVMTVRQVAELMISISDNTAADHLIDLLGRERIEEHLDDLGVSDPSLDIPLLTTREFAALKVGPASGLRQQYVAGDTADRRAILEQISDITAADLPLTDFDEPLDPDLLEWFATPNDMCRVMVHLWGSGDPVAQEILTTNPGVAPEPGTWAEVAFKGGSEPGLIAATWLTTDDAGRMFVYAGSVVNPDQLLDDLETILLMAAARDLMGAPDEGE